MNFEKQKLEGVVLIRPMLHIDGRGFLFEQYRKDVFYQNGIKVDFVQDNFSHSTKGVLRGLHYQTPPFEQDKLIQCTQGEVLDVVVDLRKNSPTCAQYQKFYLSDKNKHMLFIPKGFAHGFLCLSDTCDVMYKLSAYYNPQAQDGIIWNDTTLAIDWGVDEVLLSDKDKALKSFL